MALTIASPPPDIGGTRRPILVQFSTDQQAVTPGVPQDVTYQNNQYAAEDDTVVLEFNGITVTMTAKDAPDGSGTQFRAGIVSFNENLAYFQSNYWLGRYFEVTSPQGNRIRFTAREAGTHLNITRTASWAGGFDELSNTPGTDTVTLDNFQAWLDLYIERERDSNDYGTGPVAKLTAAQNAAGLFTFDLSAILDGHVEDCPPPALAGAILKTELPLRRFKLRYTEAWGSPPAPAAIAAGGPYFSFRGRREHESAGTHNNGFADTFLTGRPLTKTVYRGQADYLYFLVNLANAVTVTVRSYDGNGGILGTLPLAVPSYFNHTVLKIPTGPQQLSLPAGTASYTVQVFYGNPGTSRTYTFSISDKCPPHGTYLLFRNALGGYESLPVTGRKTKKGSFTHETADHLLPANYNGSTRESHSFNHAGRDGWEMHTGWVFSKGEAAYYARQFFMSENILLPSAEGNTAVNLATREVTYEKDRLNLYGFGFTLKKASPHKDRHTSYLV